MAAVDLEPLRAWIGRSQTRTELLAIEPAALVAATLDLDPEAFRNGTPLPPAFHWLYFNAISPLSQLGPDGHAARGGFLPPVALPRRMWASSAVGLKGPLLLGSAATQTTTITDVTAREGRSGALVFVKLRLVVTDATGAVAIEEMRQTVFRDDPKPGAPADAGTPAPVDETWSRTIVADPVLLFRYSAATLNGHRIHYDRPYATQVEGYPALVVHGPLVMTMLLDELRRRRPGAAIARFEMRAMRPLFEGQPFALCGRDAPDGSQHLWSRDASGAQCTDARAWLR
ncbi:MAG TPA: hypothetical protein VJM11_14285 [Nevskiaceae bacterium]|nr:hypothetical protein [Nevskiaceae bacterium]